MLKHTMRQKRNGTLNEKQHFMNAIVRSLYVPALSCIDCYLITTNGDPRKPEIANAQEYFAAQAAHRYCQVGFTMVYHDIIIGPVLDDVVSCLGNAYPVYLVVKRHYAAARTGLPLLGPALRLLWRIMHVVCSIVALS